MRGVGTLPRAVWTAWSGWGTRLFPDQLSSRFQRLKERSGKSAEHCRGGCRTQKILEGNRRSARDDRQGHFFRSGKGGMNLWTSNGRYRRLIEPWTKLKTYAGAQLSAGTTEVHSFCGLGPPRDRGGVRLSQTVCCSPAWFSCTGEAREHLPQIPPVINSSGGSRSSLRLR